MIPASVPPVTSVGAPRLTAGFAEFGRLDLRDHEEVHGDFGPLTVAELMQLAELIQLRGRGGAGFPFARKVRAVYESARAKSLPTILVVNGTEGEPASWKDKALLTRGPHLILDGAALAAYALDAEEIVIGVSDDNVGEGSIAAALDERRMPVPTRIQVVPHRFISGEGGAMVRGINGLPHIPPGRKVRASDSGVGGLPTLLSNAETFAQLAIAARIGPYEYASVGTREEPGTVLLTVGGSAAQPAVVECPTGVPLKEVLRMCDAPTGQGVLTGGYHGKWISAEAAARAEVSRKSLTEVGGTLGAGIMLPLGDDTCGIGEVARVLQYMAGESAGQCGPCYLGLPNVARAAADIMTGAGGPDAVRAAVGVVRGRGACSHPDGTGRFAVSSLETFVEDIAAHLTRDGCGRPVKGVLPLPTTGAVGSRKLAVDWSRCDGHGLCAVVLPEMIKLDGNHFPAWPDIPVPPWLEFQARKAVGMCPALALRLTDGTPHGSAAPTPRRR
ncbi:NADH-quinone oxidoreductase subunit NuoF family protein [Rhizomonospora bruguierae]|uniref:NADH-quinone oxidoreductase subunit NuoF family protein n=1 Tax=Rhizomonospora bruguierae TaxID=1581705 RepID=UPI001BD18E6D|nr:NADH-quinone oxidoreductase subunit NuoF family protein [Micromonospora sp. NBRC 107566]